MTTPVLAGIWGKGYLHTILLVEIQFFEEQLAIATKI